MIRWATPDLKCTIPKDLTFDFLIFTMKQRNTSVEKTINYSDVNDGVFYVHFEQEESSLFKAGKAEAQLNIMRGLNRLPTKTKEVEVCENLHQEVIENG